MVGPMGSCRRTGLGAESTEEGLAQREVWEEESALESWVCTCVFGYMHTEGDQPEGMLRGACSMWSILHHREPSTQERFREEDHARGTCGRQVVLGRIEGSDKDGTSLPISWLDHLSSSMLEKNVISYEASKAESKCDAVSWDGCSCFRNYHSLLFTLPSLFMRQ